MSADAALEKLYEEENGKIGYMKYVEERQKMSKDDIVGTFDKWVESGKYTKDVQALGYSGPKITGEAVAELFPSKREDVRIIDIAAGSGLLAEELRKHGFKQIDAVDPSPASEKAAMEKNLYGRYIVDFVTDQRLKIRTDEYDIAASSGGFAPGLMPCGALKEFIRIVKPGGFICLSVPEYIFEYCDEYRGRLEPLMDKYASDGVIEKLSRKRVDSYLDQKPGVLFIFRVLRSEVL